MGEEKIATEAEEQTALFEWARLAAGRYPELQLMFHIPNGGSRNRIEAMHLKQQGVRAGVPDICLPVPRGKFGALYIEMKRRKGGRLEESQRRWIDVLNRCGNMAVVCHGADEARTAILDYLRNGIPKL